MDPDVERALAYEIDALRKDLRDLALRFFNLDGADFEILQRLAREGAAIFTERDYMPDPDLDPQDWLTEQPFGRRATARALAMGLSLADGARLALNDGHAGTAIRFLCGATHCHGYVARSEDEDFEKRIRGRVAATRKHAKTRSTKARVLALVRDLEPGTSNEAAATRILASAPNLGIARRTVVEYVAEARKRKP